MTRTIRTLVPGEVEILVGWATAEGWNPGTGDATAFRRADPDGFLGAFIDGEMVAGISAIAYDEGFGFIGLYICRSDRRGQGHGKAVWDAAMARLTGRTIGLDAVPEQQGNYAAMGFVPAYETIRMSGAMERIGDTGVTPVTADVLPQIEAFDQRCFPAPRRSFLEAWLQPPRSALAVIEEGEIRGFAAFRHCVSGSKIGPLFADGDRTAARLLAALADGPLQIDVPVAQQSFISALEKAGFSRSFSTTRMYRGPIPVVEMNRVYGITTLELG